MRAEGDRIRDLTERAQYKSHAPAIDLNIRSRAKFFPIH